MTPVIAAILGGAEKGMSLALQNKQRKQNLADQKELMNVQQQNQMALNLQGQQLAQQNWDYTNAENQVEHYKNAGLNVGLMYGTSGMGGQLASGSGGSASGGQAQKFETDLSGMGMMAQQMALMQAQKANIEADTNKKNVEADKLKGVDTGNVEADIALKNMQTKNAELQNQLQNRSIEDTLDTLKANRDKAVADSAKASTEADVSITTKQAQIKKINAEAKNEAFKLAVMKSDIELNEAQMQNMLEQIKIGKFNAEKIGLDQVKGKALNQIYEKVMKYFGVDNKAME